MKLRRSMLFVPGSNAAMVSNSFIYKPDSLMFDLEDSVAVAEKDSAPMLVAHALQHPLYRQMETVVRVNPLDSAYGYTDLQAVVRAGVDVVRMPKTDSADDVRDMEAAIEQVERECGVWWVAPKCSQQSNRRSALSMRPPLPGHPST